MSLTGVDPYDPIPADRREISLNQGALGGGASALPVVFLGNKTSAGSETVSALDKLHPIVDIDDAKARFGARSELYWMVWAYLQVDRNATMYAIAVAENGSGTAATKAFTFANSATSAGTGTVQWGGQSVTFSVQSGDSVTTIAVAAKAAVNSADQGTWPFTADNSSGVLTFTSANLGPRADLVLERIQITFDKPTSTIATTISAGAITSGTGADDMTTAIGLLANDDIAITVSSSHSTSALTTTDNQAGELIAQIGVNANPSNGKSQYAFFGLVGTQAQAVTCVASAGGNSSRAFFYWAENNPMTPGMIAAIHAAVHRVGWLKYPAYNPNGYANGDGTPYPMVAPYSSTDYPTEAEQRTCLNNGVSPVAISKIGQPYLVRSVTSRSFIAGTTTSDHRSRESHIPRAIDFYWETLMPKWVSKRQPNVAADPPKGAKPVALVSYPKDFTDLLKSHIDDLAGGNPLGIYPGPVLDPTQAEIVMKPSAVTTGPVSGKLSASVELRAVQHLIGTGTLIKETGPGY